MWCLLRDWANYCHHRSFIFKGQSCVILLHMDLLVHLWLTTVTCKSGRPSLIDWQTEPKGNPWNCQWTAKSMLKTASVFKMEKVEKWMKWINDHIFIYQCGFILLCLITLQYKAGLQSSCCRRKSNAIVCLSCSASGLTPSLSQQLRDNRQHYSIITLHFRNFGSVEFL